MKMKPREIKWPVKGHTVDDGTGMSQHLFWVDASPHSGEDAIFQAPLIFPRIGFYPILAPRGAAPRMQLSYTKPKVFLFWFFWVFQDLQVPEVSLTMSSLDGPGSGLQLQRLNHCTWESFPAITPSGLGVKLWGTFELACGVVWMPQNSPVLQPHSL